MIVSQGKIPLNLASRHHSKLWILLLSKVQRTQWSPDIYDMFGNQWFYKVCQKTPCKAKLSSGRTLPCWCAMHTMQCNAALLLQLCKTHYRVAGYALLWLHEFVSLALCFFTVLSHSKRRIFMEEALRLYQHHTDFSLVFFLLLLFF